MSDLNRVQSGQPLVVPARTWNSVMDATEEYLRRRADVGSGMSASQSTSSTIIWVQNNSGADVDRMNVLGISSPAIVPADNEDAFVHRTSLVCVTPTMASHGGKFVVTSSRSRMANMAWPASQASVCWTEVV